MRVYLLHNEADAEQTLAPLLSEIGGEIQRIASSSELTPSTGEPQCLVSSVLPGNESALDFVRDLTQKIPELPIIIWSAHLDVGTGVDLMRRGAFSVLEYGCSRSSLLLTLHQAMHESEYLSRRAGRECDLRGKLESLTEGEREVMRMLLEGLTNKEIASKLAVSRRTIEARRQRIVRVTGFENLIQLVVQLAEHGLLVNARDEASSRFARRSWATTIDRQPAPLA